MPDNWNAKRLDESQTAMFDVVMGEVVPSLKAVDTKPLRALLAEPYCAAPSCAHVAEAGSQFCGAHNGREVAWYPVTRASTGQRVNVRAGSQAEAEAAING